MRILTGLLVALAALPAGLAVDQKKSAVVYFGNPDTSDSIIDEARDFIIKAGGKITHEYSVIKGFAVIAPEKALQSVRAWGSEHTLQIEEDEMVTSL